MTAKELEVKLRAEISDDIRIKEHPTLVGLSNIFWQVHEICPCPTFDVRQERDLNYKFTFPNGMQGIHNSVDMIEAKVKDAIAFFTSPEGDELLADEALPEAKINFIEHQIKPLNEGSVTV